MTSDILLNPLLEIGILLVAIALYLQITTQQNMERVETAFKNGKFSARALDRLLWAVRWLPVLCTVFGVGLIIMGFVELLDRVEEAARQGFISL